MMAGLLWYRSYMDSLANTSGYYPDIHAGHADRTSELTLTVPYLSRSVPSGYNQLELAQIIGGTMVVEGSLQSVEATAHVTKDANDSVIATYPLDNITLRGISKTVDGVLSYDGDTYDPDGTVTRKYAEVAINGSSNWQGFAVGTGNASAYIVLDEEPYVGAAASSKNGAISNTGVENGKYWAANRVNQVPDGGNMSFALGTSGGTSYVRFCMTDVANITTLNAFKAAFPDTQLLYLLATPTTESADPYTATQTVEEGGTVEFVTSNNIPVGNVSIYRRV